MSTPAISVIMSVYNGGNYLSEAIESILAQSFRDFEFIIIDDGSTDNSPKVLKQFAAKDRRIRIFSQKNKGLVTSLNLGIKESVGKYVARQDADDRSLPDRLSEQIKFLENHPQVVIVGSSIETINDKGEVLHRHAVLLNDPELRQELLVRSPFAHGSVLFKRKEAIDAGLYDHATWPAEDYDLWLRLSEYGQLANLDKYLYAYREHGAGISQKNLKIQEVKREEVRQKAWTQHDRLLPKTKINLNHYKNLDMGQLRIERIIDNNVFISKQAWMHGQKSLALRNMTTLAGNKVTYRKVAGKLKRRIKK